MYYHQIKLSLIRLKFYIIILSCAVKLIPKTANYFLNYEGDFIGAVFENIYKKM